MAYSKVERQTWNDEKVRRWGRDTREVWFYLMTSPHMGEGGGRIGAYVLDPMYAAADLSCPDDRWTPERAEAELERLDELGRVVWDPETRVVLLVHFFKHNPIPNPNNVTAAVSSIHEIPASTRVLERLAESVRTLVPEHFEKSRAPVRQPLLDAIEERLSVPSDNGSHNGSPTVTPTSPQPEHSIARAEQEHSSRPSSSTQPSGGQSKKTRRSRAAPLPKTWEPSESHQEKAEKLDLDLETEAEKFRNHAKANGRTQRDWDAAFHNWLIKADEFRRTNGRSSTSTDRRGTGSHGGADQGSQAEGDYSHLS